MLDQIRRLNALPVFEDEHQNRTARLLNSFLLGAIALTLAGVLVFPLILTEMLIPQMGLFCVQELIYLGCLVLLRRQHLRTASIVFLAVYWMLQNVAVAINGGMTGPAILNYATPILITGFIFGLPASLGLAFLTALVGAGFVYTAALGVLPPPNPITQPIGWLTLVFNLMALTVIQYWAVRSLKQVADRAQRSEHALAQHNRELGREIMERKRAEEAVRSSEQNTIRFQEYLKSLHNISIELGRADSLDDFFRMAVELGRSQLGFDRMGLWLFDREAKTEIGTFGTDRNGHTTDERHFRFPIDEFSDFELVLSGKEQLVLHNPVKIVTISGEELAEGWIAQAALWDGECVIGYISTDNALHHLPVQPYQMELLTLYGSAVGHLYARKQSEEALRQNEVLRDQFLEKLKTLHEVDLELSKAQSFDDLCRQAVELGRNRLGFDRLSVWFADSDPEYLVGSYGTDEHGQLRDERKQRIRVTFVAEMREILEGRVLITISDEAPVFNDRLQVVGHGRKAAAKLWAGDRNIGWMFTDNFVRTETVAGYRLELLALYAATIGHLATSMRTLEDLRYNGSRLRQAMRLAHLGMWEWEFAADKTTWSDEIFAMYGITAEEFTGKGSDYFNFTHPDDRQAQSDNIRKAFERSSQLGAGEDQFAPDPKEFRIVRPDGTLCHVMGDAVATVDSEGQPVRMLGILMDITERKLAEEALRASENRYRIISELISDYAFAVEVLPDGSLVGGWITDASYTRVTGYKWDEVGTTFKIYHPDDVAAARRHVALTIHGETTQGEYRIITKSGELRWLSIHRRPDWDEQENRVLRFYGVAQDITERKQFEQALQESEARYRNVVQDQTEFICRIAPNFWTTFVNEACCRFLGQTQAEIIGSSIWPNIRLEERAQVQAVLASLTPENPIKTIENRNIAGNNDQRWVQWTNRAIYDDQAQLVEYQSVGRDITERKLAEEALRESENRYRMISELMSDYAFSAEFNPDGSEKSSWIMGQAFKRVTGYEWDEVGSTDEYYHPDDAELARQHIAHTLLGNAISGEYRIITKSGELRWIYVRRYMEWDENEKRYVRYYGVAQDITEQKRTNEALRKSEAQQRALLNAIPDLIIHMDRIGTVLDFSPPNSGWTGLPSDPIGKSVFETMPSDRAQQLAYYLERGLSTGELQIWEYQAEFDGVLHEREARLIVIDSDSVLAIVRDITERKQAERALRESEERYRSVVNALTEGVILVTADGHVETSNEAVVRILGIPMEQLDKEIQQGVAWRYLREDGSEFPLEELAGVRALASGEPISNVVNGVCSPDGVTIWTEANATPLFHEGDRNPYAAVVSFSDITQRKQAEEAQRRYNDRLTVLHEIDRHILAARSPDAVATTVVEQLTQLVPCEFVSIVLYNHDITEERVFALKQVPDIDIHVGESQPVVENEVIAQLKSGQSVVTADLRSQVEPLAEMARELLARGILSAMANPMIAQGQLIGVLALASAQVNFFTPEHQQIAEELAAQVAIALHQANLNDQIARHNVELEQRVRERTAQLEAANRELDAFAYSVSHDLRAPIRALNNYSSFLQEDCAEHLNGDCRAYFQGIAESAQHMETLVVGLLEYSRINRVKAVVSQVNIVDLLDSLAARYNLHEQAQLALPPDAPTVVGKITRLEQIFGNLLTNAVKFTSSGVRAVVVVRWAEYEKEWQFSVQDNGIGIDSKHHHKIFGIFERLHTQEEFEGTGIGLAIVEKAVKEHGGRIWVTSQLGQGTTFTFTIPKDMQQD